MSKSDLFVLLQLPASGVTWCLFFKTMPATPARSQLPIFEPENIDGIKEYYNTNGLVLVRLLPPSVCEELILEQWREILLRQPFTEAYRLRVLSSSGLELDPSSSAHRDEFLRKVTAAPLPSQTLKTWTESWTLHRGFGACCDPEAFHLAGVWQHVRQSEALYSIACALTGRTEQWVDINRSIQKLPGQGETEFLHWDCNPFALDDHKECSVQGKACYTPSRFVGVLGSHTPDFHEKFRAAYAEHYPNTPHSAPKFALDHAKPDPMKLITAQREFAVPAGCVILWSSRLLHGQVKTPKSAGIEYGCYVGYMRPVDRAAYRTKAGVCELDDRLQSFDEGRAPVLWPSLDPIHYYPKRFMNFARPLLNRIAMMPPGHSTISTRVVKKSGKVVPHLVPKRASPYTPPKLDELGMKLLGKRSWE